MPLIQRQVNRSNETTEPRGLGSDDTCASFIYEGYVSFSYQQGLKFSGRAVNGRKFNRFPLRALESNKLLLRL